jgi:hypothetical protein
MLTDAKDLISVGNVPLLYQKSATNDPRPALLKLFGGTAGPIAVGGGAGGTGMKNLGGAQSGLRFSQGLYALKSKATHAPRPFGPKNLADAHQIGRPVYHCASPCHGQMRQLIQQPFALAS